MGYLITFEGGEGSGKTTQIEKLAESLKNLGHSIVQTREPGGTKLGNAIRKLLLSSSTENLHPLCELLLYAADRAQHIQEIIQPALQQNKIVICDRFQDSTTVYQGIARGIDPKILTPLSQWTNQGILPDLTLLLDLPVEIGIERSKTRLAESGLKEDRFEREAFAFHEKVRSGFLNLAKQENQRFAIIDANQDPEKIHQIILNTVQERINLKA